MQKQFGTNYKGCEESCYFLSDQNIKSNKCSTLRLNGCFLLTLMTAAAIKVLLDHQEQRGEHMVRIKHRLYIKDAPTLWCPWRCLMLFFVRAHFKLNKHLNQRVKKSAPHSCHGSSALTLAFFNMRVNGAWLPFAALRGQKRNCRFQHLALASLLSPGVCHPESNFLPQGYGTSSKCFFF